VRRGRGRVQWFRCSCGYHLTASMWRQDVAHLLHNDRITLTASSTGRPSTLIPCGHCNTQRAPSSAIRTAPVASAALPSPSDRGRPAQHQQPQMPTTTCTAHQTVTAQPYTPPTPHAPPHEQHPNHSRHTPLSHRRPTRSHRRSREDARPRGP
jgi:hypothetical protein